MNYRTFVEKVAERVEQILGADYSAVVTEKNMANGVTMTGIAIRKTSEPVGIVRYVNNPADSYNELDVDLAARSLIALYEQHKDTTGIAEIADSILDFDWVKSRLTAKLYGNGTSAEVYISAENWGYNDLILVPCVEVSIPGGEGLVKVTNALLDVWGTDAETLINIALDNMASKVSIQSLLDLTEGKTGIPAEELRDAPVASVLVITNKSLTNGAAQVIASRALLRNMYPNGYRVIPSSIHECLIAPADSMDSETLDALIQMINVETVAPEERLSDHSYFIA